MAGDQYRLRGRQRMVKCHGDAASRSATFPRATHTRALEERVLKPTPNCGKRPMLLVYCGMHYTCGELRYQLSQ